MDAKPFDSKALLDQVLMREKSFENGWWKEAEKAYDLYDADTKQAVEVDNPYNILYSNTEVLLPSLFSATPKPDIRARHKGQVIKPIPEVLTRFLTLAADSGTPGGDSLTTAMSDATLSALVPGIGYVRIKQKEAGPFPFTFESGHYKCLIWGKATRWAKVPWIAFKHPMKKDQMKDQFSLSDENMAACYEPDSDASDDAKDDCCVYEVWHKASRKVYYLCEQWTEKEVHSAEDPLKLQNFYPTPGLMLFTEKPGKLNPTPLYTYYRNQAEELNRVTVRLNKVLSAIKVRGAYNGLLGKDLEALLSDDDKDNKLVPASEAGLLAQSGGFDKHIWMLPIEKLITVAQELYRAREAIKQVIYELTGISDIIRGSSVASETATAQDLKNKWGTVRLRKMQTIVADYVRDLFRMVVDAGTEVLPPAQWKEITQIPLPTAEEKAAAIAQIQYIQTTQPQVPGQPPNPALAQYQQAAASPSWEEVLGKIKSDLQRTFLVNIQTSSTVDLDTASDKAEVTEFMNAMGQLLAGLQPLMMLGPQGVDVMKALLVGVAMRYKFGLDMVDSINSLQAPPPPPPEAGPPPEEQARIKAEEELKMAQIQSKMRIMQAEERLALAQIAAKERQLQIDLDLAGLRLQQAQTKLTQPAQTPAKP